MRDLLCWLGHRRLGHLCEGSLVFQPWFGHVERMEEKRLPNAALHGHAEGKRSRGGRGISWMENVREHLQDKNTDLTSIAPIGNGQSNECYGQDISNCQMISNDQNTNYHETRMTPRKAQLNVIS